MPSTKSSDLVAAAFGFGRRAERRNETQRGSRRNEDSHLKQVSVECGGTSVRGGNTKTIL